MTGKVSTYGFTPYLIDLLVLPLVRNTEIISFIYVLYCISSWWNDLNRDDTKYKDKKQENINNKDNLKKTQLVINFTWRLVTIVS